MFAHPTAISRADDADVPDQVRTIGIEPWIYVLWIVGGMMSCGVVFLIAWWASRKYPASMDALGVRTRAGRAFAWSQLRRRDGYNRRGQVIGFSLVAEDGSVVLLPPQALVHGHVVQDFAARMVKRTQGR